MRNQTKADRPIPKLMRIPAPLFRELAREAKAQGRTVQGHILFLVGKARESQRAA